MPTLAKARVASSNLVVVLACGSARSGDRDAWLRGIPPHGVRTGMGIILETVLGFGRAHRCPARRTVTGLPLERVELLDCTGAVSHTLTLLVDGTVEIRFRDGHTARVDPSTRQVLTPGIGVHRDLVDAAAGLRPRP